MSDLHFEFLTKIEIDIFADKLINSASTTTPDVLALCGDIFVVKPDKIKTFKDFLATVTPYYRHIVHLPGNHEYYWRLADVGYVEQTLKELEVEFPKYTFLNNKTIEIDDVVIAGTTLWFDYDNPLVYVYQNYINDFTQIPGGHDFLQKASEASKSFIKGLEKVDVLLTHHGVTPYCAERFAGNPANIYYHTNIADDLYRLKPKYSIHGHTHEFLNYHVNNTHVLTNPYGYNGEGLRKGFSFGRCIEVNP